MDVNVKSFAECCSTTNYHSCHAPKCPAEAEMTDAPNTFVYQWTKIHTTSRYIQVRGTAKGTNQAKQKHQANCQSTVSSDIVCFFERENPVHAEWSLLGRNWRRGLFGCTGCAFSFHCDQAANDNQHKMRVQAKSADQMWRKEKDQHLSMCCLPLLLWNTRSQLKCETKRLLTDCRVPT